ncbi:hypothetical protein RB595_005643 [Gaeumannomyces hyphopodioides]
MVTAPPQPRTHPSAIEINRSEALRIMRATRPTQTPSGTVTDQDMRRQVRESDLATRRQAPRRDAEFWAEQEQPQGKKWKNRGFMAGGGRKPDNRAARDRRELKKMNDKFCREIKTKFPDLAEDEIQSRAAKQADEWQENLMKKRKATKAQDFRGGGSIIYNDGEKDIVDDEDALNGVVGRQSVADSLPFGILPEQDIKVYTVYKTHPFSEEMAGDMGDSHIRVQTFLSMEEANHFAAKLFSTTDDPILRSVEARIEEESAKYNEREGMFWGHRRYADGTVHLVFVDEERVQVGNMKASHFKGKKLSRRFIDAFAPLRFDVWALYTDPFPEQETPTSAPAQQESHQPDAGGCSAAPSDQEDDGCVSRDVAVHPRRASSAPPIGKAPDKPNGGCSAGCREQASTARQCLPKEVFYTPPKSKQLLYRELVRSLPASLTRAQAETDLNSSQDADDQQSAIGPDSHDSHDDDDDDDDETARPPGRTTMYPVHIRAFTTLGDANYHALLTYLSVARHARRAACTSRHCPDGPPRFGGGLQAEGVFGCGCRTLAALIGTETRAPAGGGPNPLREARAHGIDVAAHEDLTLDLYNRPEYGLALDFRHLCIQVVRTELEGPWPIGQGLMDAADPDPDPGVGGGGGGGGGGAPRKEWEEWVRRMQQGKRSLALRESRAEREAGEELERKRKEAKAAREVKLMQLRDISDRLHGVTRRSHQKRKKAAKNDDYDDDDDDDDEAGRGRAEEEPGMDEQGQAGELNGYNEPEESESEESESEVSEEE